MEELQQKLDLQKWFDSEKVSKDMCGEYEYCAYCNNAEQAPCADAYTKWQNKTAKKSVAKKEEKPAKAKTTAKATAPAKEKASAKAKTTAKAKTEKKSK